MYEGRFYIAAPLQSNVLLHARREFHEQIDHFQRERVERLFPERSADQRIVGQAEDVQGARQIGVALDAGVDLRRHVQILRLQRNRLHRLHLTATAESHFDLQRHELFEPRHAFRSQTTFNPSLSPIPTSSRTPGESARLPSPIPPPLLAAECTESSPPPRRTIHAPSSPWLNAAPRRQRR